MKQHREQAFKDKVNELLTALLNAGTEDEPDVLATPQNAKDYDNESDEGATVL